MKIIILIIIAVLTLYSIADKKERGIISDAYIKDPEKFIKIVKGNMVKLKLEKGKEHLIPTHQEKSMLSLGLKDDGFAIGEMSQGKILWSVFKDEDKLRFSRTHFKGNDELVIIDQDGDGLADIRLTIMKDKDGKFLKTKKEKILYTFKEE